MKYILVVLLLFIMPDVWSQEKYNTITYELISAETNKIYNKLVKLRREFHAKPELAGNEKRTQEIIKHYLLDLKIEVKTDVYGYGVIGILNGEKKGKKIAWRAEMDALPINGVQHGCGHDVHLAIALGIAETLAKNKKSLNGTVYFIFQPEEETFAGAKRMIEHGLFSNIQPDEIYALHVTDLPVGKIMVKPGEMFAYQKKIRVELKNEMSKDQAKDLALKIQASLARSQPNGNPSKIQHISDPVIGLMSPNTIFNNYLIIDDHFTIYSENDKLYLETYLYETKQSNLQKIIPKIEQLIAKEQLNEKLFSVSFIQENPTVVNDERLTKSAVKTLNRIYGKDLLIPDYGQVPYFNDDFAYFQQKVPGVYFFLGGSNVEKGIVAMNHAPNFNVDEESIRIGVRSFSSLIVQRLDGR